MRSAWNDNGMEGIASNPAETRRTSFFPGKARCSDSLCVSRSYLRVDRIGVDVDAQYVDGAEAEMAKGVLG